MSLPSIHSGNFDSIYAAYVEKSAEELGSLQVKWVVQSHYNDVKQWNVIWYERTEGTLHKIAIEPHKNTCVLPIKHRR